MNYMFYICIALITSWLPVGESVLPWSDNVVKGQVIFPEEKNKTIQRGTNYYLVTSSEKDKSSDSNLGMHTFVSLHPLSFTPEISQANAQISQRNKTFFPHVVAITKGSTVYFLNEDEHFHNVFSISKGARFNIGRRPPGNVYGKTIKKAGIVKLGCDIHPEMGAVILSYDTPYYTQVQEDGKFEFGALPDGEYELRAYHPVHGVESSMVSCAGNQVIEKEIRFKQ